MRYPRLEECQGHEDLGPITRLGAGVRDVTLGALLDRADARLGDGASLQLSRDVALRLSCPSCGRSSHAGVALGTLKEADAACPGCGAHRVVSAPSRSETVAVLREARIESRLQYLKDALLDEPVEDGGDPELSDTAILLWNRVTSHGLRLIAPREEILA